MPVYDPNATGPPAPAGATSSDLAAAIADTPSPPAGASSGLVTVAMQWGAVVSIQAGPPQTLTLTLAGSPTPIPGVKYMANYSPNIGDTVIIWSVGTDLVVAGGLSGVVASEGPIVGDILMTTKNKTDLAWLLCNGGTFSAVTYPALNTYLGSTTLPNLTNFIPMGAGSTVALGATAGSTTSAGLLAHVHGSGGGHTHTSAAHVHGSGGPHTHTYNTGSLTAGFGSGGLSADNSNPSTSTGSTDPGNTASTTPGASGSTDPGNTASAGAGSSFSVLNPVMGVYWWIRAL
jgi:hypothetical protein